MPPRTKKMTTNMPGVTNDVTYEPGAILMVDPEQPLITSIKSTYEPSVGDFIHVLTSSGAKFKSCELLQVGDKGIAIRTDLNGPTSAEVSFIPWSAIVGVGLIGKR